MYVPFSFTAYARKVFEEVYDRLDNPTITYFSRYALLISGDHAWLFRDEIDGTIRVSYMSPDATTVTDDEDPSQVAGMILAAME